MRCKAVMLLVLMSTGICSGQEKLNFNGIYWNGMSVMQKLGFVQGYVHINNSMK
jgi:hypothetical protein